MNKRKRTPARTTVGRKPGVVKKARPESGRRRRRVGVGFIPKAPITSENPRRRRRRRGLVPRGPRRVDIMKIKRSQNPITRRRRRTFRRKARIR